MLYWFFQVGLLLGFTLLGFTMHYSFSDLEQSKYLIKYFLIALPFPVLSHFLLRTAAHKFKREYTETPKRIIGFALILLLCGFLTATWKSQIRAIGFFIDPDQTSPSVKVELGSEEQTEQDKQQITITIGNTQVESIEQDKVAEQAIDKPEEKLEENIEEKEKTSTSGQTIGNALIFSIWLMCYFCIVGIRNRMQIKDQVRKQQLAILMSQLNPHFLFNSMNSIRGMIFEDTDKAKQLIRQLTELFKYNLQSNQKITMTLQQELEICQFYLEIEQTRLEDRLVIDYQLDTSLNHYAVPTMSALTLIENAIKHGIAPQTSPSTLTIKTQAKLDHLQISVINPVYCGDYKAKGTGTGLSNLKARLKLMYGKWAEVKVSEENEQFRVDVLIPFKQGLVNV